MIMRKLIFLGLMLTLAGAGSMLGQTPPPVRGESIFGNNNATTNKAGTNVPVTAANFVAADQHAVLPDHIPDGSLVGFDKLSGFPMPMTAELGINTNAAWANAKVEAMIPPVIRALDGHTVQVEGFMMPIQLEKDKTVEFILLHGPFGCCFGKPPEIHQFIKVRAKPPGVQPILGGPARVQGILYVGADREKGVLRDIYRMDAETVVPKP